MKNCFVNESPEFLKEVIYNGDVIATIRALTQTDKADIRKIASFRAEIVEGKPEIAFDSEVYENATICISLGGTINGKTYKKESEGWVFDRQVTMDNVDLLIPSVRESIIGACNELYDFWDKNKDGLVKN